MNMMLIAAGAAVLIVYLAGRRAAKEISEEPWTNGGGAGADPDTGGGYYGGGSGGGEGMDSGQFSSNVAPLDSVAGISLLGTPSNGLSAQKSAFTSSLGYGSIGARADQSTLKGPGLTDDATRSTGLSYGDQSTRSALVQSTIASANPLGSSSQSLSTPQSTILNPRVTSMAVAAQPVRTTSTSVASVSAATVRPAPVATVAPRPAPVAPVSTRQAFTSTLVRR